MHAESLPPPRWLGPLIVAWAVVAALLAGRVWPVVDDAALGGSSAWAGRAVVALSGAIGLAGVGAAWAMTREGARIAAFLAGALAIWQMVTTRFLIPYEPPHAAHHKVHDVLALAVVLTAVTALHLMRPTGDPDVAGAADEDATTG